ncbi:MULTISPECIES: zinc ABC transporter substrate-binding protein [unclassified Leptolyngbya]|uniref:metal ABC transporter solute-binding protein, Zn/Mn family n=1 Tax=unclassified Leptolyngbya TaxID=2650499 RepID=UPI001686E207|nr:MULTISPECIES: zinc ABC transporter substrate-binding protein [unclassified Leptolyngbya]MBD1912828.1 zinc ABC transporter substrate-binding protein [Leptolyngbya sp. FACHB-8]MBD2157775.1 zinc ABC transporter substrate-binding protein [Leptolyngbya sp. FACHB-16]
MRVRTYPSWLRQALLIGLGTIAFSLGGCDQSSPSAGDNSDDRPDVVATSTMIADWTARIGGDEIELTGLLQPGADPHVYEPVPADSIAFEKADLILYNGYNLEPGLIKMMNAAGVNARKVAVGEVVQPLDLNYEGRTVPDPHVWGDVQNVIKMVKSIRDELIQLSPQDEAEFTTNAEAFIAELEKLDQWVNVQISTVPSEHRQLITTHDAFQYYANAYGLKVTGTLIGISTEEQPSAQTVQKLAESIRSQGVPAIFAETTINPRLITTVAEEAGVKLADTHLYSDSIGAPGSAGDTYVGMVVSNTQAIVENLGGQYTDFQADN